MRKPKGVKCPAIDGVFEEADHTAGEVNDKPVLDEAIVGAAQAIEHYEICLYGTLIAWAEELGHNEVLRSLNGRRFSWLASLFVSCGIVGGCFTTTLLPPAIALERDRAFQRIRT